MKYIIEVVTFNIKNDVCVDKLLKASNKFEVMLRREVPGFVKRTLTKHCEKELWVEMLWWNSMTEAENALEIAPKTIEFENYNSLLEEEGSEIYYLEEK